jgi:hypothetical protein
LNECYLSEAEVLCVFAGHHNDLHGAS